MLPGYYPLSEVPSGPVNSTGTMMVLFSWTQGTPTICQQLPQSASIAYAEAIGTWFV